MPNESTATPTTGTLIYRQRQVLCITQRDLAAKVGVSQPAVAKWEADEAVPALRHRRQLADALGVHLSFLFGEQVAA